MDTHPMTVISGLLSAPEYKPHPLNFEKIIIFNINVYKPQVPTGTLKQMNFTQAKMNIKSNTIVIHIISFASYDTCTVALREHSCKSQSEARTVDGRQRDRRKFETSELKNLKRPDLYCCKLFFYFLKCFELCSVYAGRLWLFFYWTLVKLLRDTEKSRGAKHPCEHPSST